MNYRDDVVCLPVSRYPDRGYYNPQLLHERRRIALEKHIQGSDIGRPALICC
jgi:hypothetical protein